MKRIDALKALLERVEAGDRNGTGWHDVSRAVGLHPDDRHILAIKAWDGSLDAAKALHDAVLPDWGFEVCEFAADVTNRHTNDGLDGYKWFNANCDNPARAWLIAILKALISEEKLDAKQKQ